MPFPHTPRSRPTKDVLRELEEERQRNRSVSQVSTRRSRVKRRQRKLAPLETRAEFAKIHGLTPKTMRQLEIAYAHYRKKALANPHMKGNSLSDFRSIADFILRIKISRGKVSTSEKAKKINIHQTKALAFAGYMGRRRAKGNALRLARKAKKAAVEKAKKKTTKKKVRKRT
jgi:hypothetical protein